jgi:hypothetical protein
MRLPFSLFEVPRETVFRVVGVGVFIISVPYSRVVFPKPLLYVSRSQDTRFFFVLKQYLPFTYCSGEVDVAARAKIECNSRSLSSIINK